MLALAPADGAFRCQSMNQVSTVDSLLLILLSCLHILWQLYLNVKFSPSATPTLFPCSDTYLFPTQQRISPPISAHAAIPIPSGTYQEQIPTQKVRDNTLGSILVPTSLSQLWSSVLQSRESALSPFHFGTNSYNKASLVPRLSLPFPQYQ
jgi:hypothetical protein